MRAAKFGTLKFKNDSGEIKPYAFGRDDDFKITFYPYGHPAGDATTADEGAPADVTLIARWKSRLITVDTAGNAQVTFPEHKESHNLLFTHIFELMPVFDIKYASRGNITAKLRPDRDYDLTAINEKVGRLTSEAAIASPSASAQSGIERPRDRRRQPELATHHL